MNKIFYFSTSCLVVISAFTLTAFNTMNITDYLSVPGPVVFEKEHYALSWSVHDNDHYKQEYLRAKDSLEGFNKMVFIDVFLTDIDIKKIVAAKIQEVESRKGKDPVAHYQIRENDKTGEYLLDFLISEGKLYEWNAYRYKSINTSKGKAVMLFAYCFRSFKGAELSLDEFFPSLKKNRLELIEKTANYHLPGITIKQ